MITASQRAQIQLALGPEVLKVTEDIHEEMERRGEARPALWLGLLRALNRHSDLMETAQGRSFADALLKRVNVGDYYVPSGCIPDVLKGTVRNLRSGCYTFGDILDLAAHHLVWIGEATTVEARLRGGAVTVRAFLRERYGVFTGKSERGHKSDLKRFRLWLADARWRIRRLRADEKRREHWRRVRAWSADTPNIVM